MLRTIEDLKRVIAEKGKIMTPYVRPMIAVKDVLDIIDEYKSNVSRKKKEK